MQENIKDEAIPEIEEPISGEQTPKNEGDDTPKNDFISKDKFEEIDKARRAFYEENKQLKAKLKQFEPTSTKEVKSDEWRDRVDFLLVNRDFNKQEFDHISAVAKRDSISLQEAAEKEMDYISFRRKKLAEENKIPASSAAKGSSLRKSEEDIRKMTSAELQAYEAQLEKADEGGEI